MANRILPQPTAGDVIRAEKKFNDENHSIEWTMSQLFRKFPANTELRDVAVKTKVLNALYGTRILAVNVVASHIVNHKIDSDLAAGKPDVVDRVAKVRIKDKTRINFSFASKYCSWHNPDAYPIYDRNAEACLWSYKRQDGFSEFARDEYEYEDYVRRVRDFRDFYGLTSLSFKQLDKFLYDLGATFLANRGT